MRETGPVWCGSEVASEGTRRTKEQVSCMPVSDTSSLTFKRRHARNERHEQRALLLVLRVFCLYGRGQWSRWGLWGSVCPLLLALERGVVHVPEHALKRADALTAHQGPLLNTVVDEQRRDGERGHVKCDLLQQGGDPRRLVERMNRVRDLEVLRCEALELYVPVRRHREVTSQIREGDGEKDGRERGKRDDADEHVGR